MKDPDVIKTFITNTYPDGSEVLNDCEPLVLDTLNHTECTAITNIIVERLQYIYIYKYKDNIIDCLNRFSKGGWTSCYGTVNEVRTKLPRTTKQS